MKLLPYKYFIHFVSNGKIVKSEFCETLEDVKVFRAIASGKGYGFEVFNLYDGKKENKSSDPVSEPTKQRIVWERSVRCVETGNVYSSVTECSKETGIKYRAIINALKNGSQRNGLHFVCETSLPQKKPKQSNRGGTSQKYICITTNQIFSSAFECMAFCGVPTTTFYRALKQGKPINGLLFSKLK